MTYAIVRKIIFNYFKILIDIKGWGWYNKDS